MKSTKKRKGTSKEVKKKAEKTKKINTNLICFQNVDSGAISSAFRPGIERMRASARPKRNKKKSK